jgi:hypothetical protein
LVPQLEQFEWPSKAADMAKLDANANRGANTPVKFEYKERYLPFPSVTEHFCSPDFNATTFALTILYRGYHMNDLRDHYLQAMSSFSLGKYIASKGSADSSIQPRKSGTILLGKQVN